jgi:rod shape-determining protein MreB
MVGVGARGWLVRGTARQLAVDLGTANTVVFRHGAGIVLFEPSVVAIDERSGRVHAVGEDARRMIGRTPAYLRAIRPLRHGVISDFETTEQMLRYFIRRVLGRGSGRTDVMLCIPSGLTQVERSAVVDAVLAAGASRAFLIEEALAAAIGAELPVSDPLGSMVVDVGGGTSEMAVTSLGSMAVSTSLRVGGYDLDEAIARSVLEADGLLIGLEQAEALKLRIGAAVEGMGGQEADEVAGRDPVIGLLRRTTIGADRVHAALQRPLKQIAAAVNDTLERTPPELSADLASYGMTLVGGGALLPGFDELLRRHTGLRVTVADDPLTAVARGAGSALGQLEHLTPETGSRRRR